MNDTAQVDEDGTVTIDVLTNDSDVDGDTLAIESAVANHGVVVINSISQLVYTPNTDFNCVDTITYQLVDGMGGRTPGTVVVTVISQSEGQISPPQITPISGTYQAPLTVTISHADTAATIEYSLDNITWQTYGQTLSLSENSSVYARAKRDDYSDSSEVTAAYLLEAALPKNVESPTKIAAFVEPNPQDNASASIGLMNESFRVDESGAATYTLPLGLPNGIADVTPQLGLNYSSMRANGIMGIGWSLSGLSAIVRCRQTYEQDGQYREITLTNEDRFCLDGQRLIAIDDGPNGGDGTVYKTEIDSKVHVTSVGTAGNGPESFTVKRADGSTTYYGKHVANATSHISVSSEDATVVSWLMGKVEDNMSNAINFNYMAGSGEHEVLIDTITYSGNTVDFQYKTGDLREDITSGFSAGIKMSQTARLDDIVIENHNQQAIASYHLNYDKTLVINNQTQLHSITQCDGSSTGVCLEPTVFDWKNETVIIGTPVSTDFEFAHSTFVTTFPIDYNGDGLTDFAYVGKSEQTNQDQYIVNFRRNMGDGRFELMDMLAGYSFFVDKNYNPLWQVLDIDGDGKQDILSTQMRNEISDWYIATMKNDGTGYNQTAILSSGYSMTFTDLTGDGLADMVYRDNNIDYVRINLGGTFKAAQSVTFPRPSQNTTAVTANPDADTHSTLYSYVEADKAADFNGDGLTDMMIRQVEVTESTITVTTQDSREVQCNVEHHEYFKQAYTTDFDHDTFTFTFNLYDRLPGNSSYDLVTSEVTTATPESDCPIGKLVNITNEGGDLFPIDINGDGITDAIQQNMNSGAWEFIASNGAGFEAPNAVGNLTGDIKHAQFGDMNNDGLLDFIYFVEHDDSTRGDWFYQTYNNGSFNDQIKVINNIDLDQKSLMWIDGTGNGKLDYLMIDYVDQFMNLRKWGDTLNNKNLNSRIKTITNGFNLKTEITYKPLTDATVYTKGQGAVDIDDYG
ncbi:MAG: FG-GAP-like repeat-containing protein, partial [Psychrosphaera sp.]|nr:FG-GAP-like repeat-containing protein [Psychrosphaera sp.]